jgi:hypothetical protein
MGFQMAKHGNAASPICFCILDDIGGFGRLAAKATQIRASATMRQNGSAKSAQRSPRTGPHVFIYGAMEAPTMKLRKRGQAKKSPPKRSLNLPHLDQSRSAVLNSLPSKESQRGYRNAIDEFIELVLLGTRNQVAFG